MISHPCPGASVVSLYTTHSKQELRPLPPLNTEGFLDQLTRPTQPKATTTFELEWVVREG